MKKIFLFLLTVALFSCAGEVYQEEVVVKDGLAYKKESWVNWDPIENPC